MGAGVGPGEGQPSQESYMCIAGQLLRWPHPGWRRLGCWGLPAGQQLLGVSRGGLRWLQGWPADAGPRPKAGSPGPCPSLIIGQQVAPPHAILGSQVVCPHRATAAVGVELRLHPSLLDLPVTGGWGGGEGG